jgi:hypothetical protein
MAKNSDPNSTLSDNARSQDVTISSSPIGYLIDWMNAPVASNEPESPWLQWLHRLRWWQALVGLFGVLFVALIVVSYWGPFSPEWWGWTGFCGNTLWDWLGLLLVPAALGVAAPLYAKTTALSPRSWSQRRVFVLAGGLFLIALMVVFAYMLHWPQTGFWSPAGTGPGRCVLGSGSQSKTLWDWLTLLLLPLSVAAATIQFNRELPQASETPK